jgi:hypothetical protein
MKMRFKGPFQVFGPRYIGPFDQPPGLLTSAWLKGVAYLGPETGERTNYENDML